MITLTEMPAEYSLWPAVWINELTEAIFLIVQLQVQYQRNETWNEIEESKIVHSLDE